MISYRSKDYLYSYNKMKPKAFSTHLHQYYEFLYFVQGDATYIVEGVEYVAEDGDLFITRPGEMHSIVFKSEREYERHFIQISEELLGDLDVDILATLRRKGFGKNNKISHTVLDKDFARRCFLGVEENVVNKKAESEILIKTYIIQLIAEINRLSEKSQTGGTSENERVRSAKDYINKNLCAELKLDKIAEAAYTDKYYLSHLFKKETGISVKDYISMQRIALAKKLIGKGGSASEVYCECGFGDYSSFYRAFKRLTGKSPAEFFKKMK